MSSHINFEDITLHFPEKFDEHPELVTNPQEDKADTLIGCKTVNSREEDSNGES
jgi:hypothetical protein